MIPVFRLDKVMRHGFETYEEGVGLGNQSKLIRG